MHDPNILRERARRCRSLLKVAVDPDVMEQLRVWAVELVDEADTAERCARSRPVEAAFREMLATRRGAMSVEKRALYNSPNGDKWFLARDPASGNVIVRHEANLPSGGRVTEVEIGAFLSKGPRNPEHQALLDLIGTLLEGRSEGRRKVRGS